MSPTYKGAVIALSIAGCVGSNRGSTPLTEVVEGPSKQLFDATLYLPLENIRLLTQTTETYIRVRPSDSEQTSYYDAIYYSAENKPDSHDLMFRVWYNPPDLQSVVDLLERTLPNSIVENSEVGTRAWIYNSAKGFRTVAFVDDMQKSAAIILCGDDLCKTNSIALKLANSLHERLSYASGGVVRGGELLADLAPRVRIPKLPSNIHGFFGYNKVYALIIGIPKTGEGWQVLPNADVDAKNFAREMKRRGATVRHLKPTESTRSGILAEMETAYRSVKGDHSLFLFYFAGHGQSLKGSGYIIPYGASRDSAKRDHWISMDELKTRALEYSQIKHQVYILGSCFSGKLLTARASSPPEGQAVRPALEWIEKTFKSELQIALTAGGENELVPDGRANGSDFGNAVVGALTPFAGTGYSEADRDADNCVTHYEWAAYVNNHGRTRLNSPSFGPLLGTGEFAICNVP